MRALPLSLAVGMLLAGGACGGGDSTSDPRCEAACANATDDYGVKCDSQSVEACRTACEAKIYGVTSVCGTCLLEGAELQHPFIPLNCGDYVGGESPTCTETVEGRSCSYGSGVESEYRACLTTWFPENECSCSSDFPHDLQDCVDFCKQ